MTRGSSRLKRSTERNGSSAAGRRAGSGSGVTVDLSLGAVEQVGAGGEAEGDILVNVENIIGSIFVDTLTGDSNANVLNGGDSDDTLYGNSGTDTLYGDAGRDTLYGGAGDDVLYGGDNDDTLLGGEGKDNHGNQYRSNYPKPNEPE